MKKKDCIHVALLLVSGMLPASCSQTVLPQLDLYHKTATFTIQPGTGFNRDNFQHK